MRRIILGLGAALLAAVPLGLAVRPRPDADFAVPATVTLPPAAWTWRPFGEWRRDGVLVVTPRLRQTAATPLHIMIDLVAQADYAVCVAEGACRPADRPAEPGHGGYPQTGVSWHDAQAYAAWLSGRTGRRWRLPTDAEWQRFAAERFGDDAVAAGGADPSSRWLAEYGRATELRGAADPVLRPAGGWGANSLGLNDLAGNVWEWTDGCITDAVASGSGPFAELPPYCGVRIAEGRHRAPVIDFVRDAAVGGCGLGIPPDHLGFRLVTEDPA